MAIETRDEKREILQLGGLMALPLLAVLILASVSLQTAYQERETTQTLETEMKHAETVRHLIHLLQRERGASCLYVSTNNSSSEKQALQQNLWQTRMNTSMAWDHHGRDKQMEAALGGHRLAVDRGERQCDSIVDFYHEIINYLISTIIEEFRNTNAGNLWHIIQAYTSWIDGKEAVGMKRAMGSQFFPKGYFSQRMAKKYYENNGIGIQTLSISEKELPWVAQQRSLMQAQHISLFINLSRLENIIDHNNLSQPDPSLGLDWYTSMTIYINLLGKIEQNIADHLSEALNLKSSQLFEQFLRVFFMSGACLVLCPVMAALYIAHSRKLFAKISKTTSALMERTVQLAVEETKTNNLLHQLLPPSIAKLLKEGNAVPPQSFASVTVFFSDIVEFTSLAAQSNPMQVVNMLNSFYTEFDQIIDAHDCYKVETIGDAYLIVSGLPLANGVSHSNEMALLSLAVIDMATGFIIPHMPHRRLMVRIGLHTGACVAGVIGTKAPKYGVFGDTVNTASRMESTGEAMRIHVSEATFHHLCENHLGYEFQKRGSSIVKGKGKMTTYWLESKITSENVDFRRTTRETPLPGSAQLAS